MSVNLPYSNYRPFFRSTLGVSLKIKRLLSSLSGLYVGSVFAQCIAKVSSSEWVKNSFFMVCSKYRKVIHF